MNTPVTHYLTDAGTIACSGRKGYLTRKLGEKGIYITWRPDDVTCLSCQLAVKKMAE